MTPSPIYSVILLATLIEAKRLRNSNSENQNRNQVIEKKSTGVADELAKLSPSEEKLEASFKPLKVDFVEKQYLRDESFHLVAGNEIDNESPIKQKCQTNESFLEFNLFTDNYGYETSWSLEALNESVWERVDFGPPENMNYADNTYYRSHICIPNDQRYRLTISDDHDDGLCCGNGKGKYQYLIDGMLEYDSNYEPTFLDSVSHEIEFDYDLPATPLPLPLPADLLTGSKSEHLVDASTRALTDCGANRKLVTIQIKTDTYGNEVSWDLQDSQGNILADRPIGTYGVYSTEQVDVCVDHGTVFFTAKDGFGDGWCCAQGEGYYKLFIDSELVYDGYDFLSGTEKTHKLLIGYDMMSLGMTQREKEYLYEHNWRRKQWHESHGTTYVPQKWSTGLSIDAAHWANELLNDCHIVGIEHEPGVLQGENLAKNTGYFKTWGKLYDVTKIVRRWVEREVGWPYPANAHLTQTLWRTSRYVGCAESVKNMSATRLCRVQVCRYVKAGNCNMAAHNATVGENWKVPMLSDINMCGPDCPPEGCF